MHTLAGKGRRTVAKGRPVTRKLQQAIASVRNQLLELAESGADIPPAVALDLAGQLATICADLVPAPKRKGEPSSVVSRAWSAYKQAYLARYGAPPVVSAHNNGVLANLEKRLPAADLPSLCAWFVNHNKAWYVDRGHALSALLKDADGLYTQYLTGNQTTSTGARQGERKDAFADAAKKAANIRLVR